MQANRDNAGALFRNPNKENEKQPDYTGNVTVNGRAFWVSGWINEAKNGGGKYMALRFTPADNGAAAQAPGGYDSVPF